MTFEPLNRILEEAIKRLPNIEQKKREGLAIAQWPELVGSILSEHTAAEFVRKGTLFVRVSDPIWMQELQFLKPVLIRRIDEEIGEGIILEIHLRMGEISPTLEKEKEEGHPSIKRIPKRKKEEIERVLSEISDLELKEGLRRIFTKAARISR